MPGAGVAERQWEAPQCQYDAWVSTCTAIAAGQLANITDDVRTVTGHQPESLRRYLHTRHSDGSRCSGSVNGPRHLTSVDLCVVPVSMDAAGLGHTEQEFSCQTACFEDAMGFLDVVECQHAVNADVQRSAIARIADVALGGREAIGELDEFEEVHERHRLAVQRDQGHVDSGGADVR